MHKIACFLLLTFQVNTSFSQINWGQEIEFISALNVKESTGNKFSVKEYIQFIGVSTATSARWAINESGDSLSAFLGVGIEPITLAANLFFAIVEDDYRINPFYINHGFSFHRDIPKGSLDIGYKALLSDREETYFKSNYVPGIFLGGTFTILKNMEISLALNSFYSPTGDIYHQKNVNKELKIYFLHGLSFSTRYRLNKRKIKTNSHRWQ